MEEVKGSYESTLEIRMTDLHSKAEELANIIGDHVKQGENSDATIMQLCYFAGSTRIAEDGNMEQEGTLQGAIVGNPSQIIDLLVKSMDKNPSLGEIFKYAVTKHLISKLGRSMRNLEEEDDHE